ncbi:hypothetical protein [Caudoviricetes sp.]|nr:hypothetical protein [Caudoviricetes sp.]
MMTTSQDAFIAEAKAQGFTDDQLKEYLSGGSTTDTARPTQPAAATSAPAPVADPQDAFMAEAKAQGFTDEQIHAYMGDPAHAKSAKRPNAAKVIATPDPSLQWQSSVPAIDKTGKVVSSGLETLDPAVVQSIAQRLQVDPTTKAGINAVYASEARRRNKSAPMNSDQLATFTKLADTSKPWTWLKSNFSGDADREYAAIKQDNIDKILSLAKERGLSLEYSDGQFFTRNAQGQQVHVTPSVLQDLGKSKYEIAGGLVGSIAGAVGGNAIVNNMMAAGPVGRGAATAIRAIPWLAGAVGGLVGAVGGNQVDYLSSAIEAQERLDAKVALEKAIGSVQMSVLGEIGGAAAFKALATTYKATKAVTGVAADVTSAVYKGIIDSYKKIQAGETDAAYTTLKEAAGFLTDDQAHKIVARWEALNGRAAPGKDLREKALAIVPITSAGGDRIIQAVSHVSPAAAVAISSEVNQRAHSLLKAANNITTSTTGQELVEQLGKYVNDVETNFDVVKHSTGFVYPAYKFNLNEMLTNFNTDGIVASSKLGSLKTTINQIKKNVNADPIAQTKKLLETSDIDSVKQAMQNVKWQDNGLGSKGHIDAVFAEALKLEQAKATAAAQKQLTTVKQSIAGMLKAAAGDAESAVDVKAARAIKAQLDSSTAKLEAFKAKFAAIENDKDFVTKAKALLRASDIASIKQATKNIGWQDNGLGSQAHLDAVMAEATRLEKQKVVKSTQQKVTGVMPSVVQLLQAKLRGTTDLKEVQQIQSTVDAVLSKMNTGAFPDLLDLRQVLIEFRDTKKLNGADLGVLSRTLSAINNEIGQVANRTKAGRQWLQDWKAANDSLELANNLKSNVLFKAVTRPGMDESDIAKTLIKYGNAFDNTYTEVTSKLPVKTLINVEGKIVQQLAEKHTIGDEGGFRATQFPELAKELSVYKFATPGAQRLVEAVKRLAQVYQIDPSLANSAGSIYIKGSSNYLAADPKSRLTYEVMTRAFDWLKRKLPTKNANELSMVYMVADLLENPLNANTTKHVLAAVKGDQELTHAITKMQAQVAADIAAGKAAVPRTQVYKDAAGRLWDTTEPSGSRRIDMKGAIPTHRIVGEADVMQHYGIDKLDASTLTKAVKTQLLNSGYSAIRLSTGQIIKLQ